MGGVISFIIMALIVVRIVKKTQGVASETNKPTRTAVNVRTDFQPSSNTVKVKTNTNANASAVRVNPPVANVKPSAPKTTGVNKDLRGGTQGSTQVVNNRSRTTISSLSDTMENRKNDWLTRQLNEERIAKKRMSEMFNLKQEHAANCDASHVRIEHYNNCDAGGIDRVGN